MNTPKLELICDGIFKKALLVYRIFLRGNIEGGEIIFFIGLFFYLFTTISQFIMYLKEKQVPQLLIQKLRFNELHYHIGY